MDVRWVRLSDGRDKSEPCWVGCTVLEVAVGCLYILAFVLESDRGRVGIKGWRKGKYYKVDAQEHQQVHVPG